MGVDEFRSELASIKDSYESNLITDKEIYQKMCIDAQRRNLSNLSTVSSDRPPLNFIGLKRLLWPVFITVTALGLFITILVGCLYKSLSDEMKSSKQSLITSLPVPIFSGLSGSDSGPSTLNFDSSLKSNLNTSILSDHVGEHDKFDNVTDRTISRESKNINNNDYSVNNRNAAKPLYYISTSDGILSHFFQLQHLWSITHHLNRSLVPVSFHSSNHYQDVEWINLCDIFELPSDINCSGHDTDVIYKINGSNAVDLAKKSNEFDNTTSIQIEESTQQHLPTEARAALPSVQTIHLLPNIIAKSHKCTMLGVYSWAMDPHLYSLPDGQQPERKFDFSQGDCVAGYVDDRSGYIKPKKSHSGLFTFPLIKFKDKYVKILNSAKMTLGLKENENFTVVHWVDDESGRRGKECDEKSREKEKENDKEKEKNLVQGQGNGNSNCMTPHDLMKSIQKSINENERGNLIYIATTEKNISILSQFSKEGYRHFSDLNLVSLNSLEVSILELGLLAASSHQIFWGKSFFKTFSELLNSQKKK